MALAMTRVAHLARNQAVCRGKCPNYLRHIGCYAPAVEMHAGGSMVSERLERLAQAVKGEFREMPGLRLTRAQLQRLYSMDGATCDQLLVRLMNEHFLSKTDNHRFGRADETGAATR